MSSPHAAFVVTSQEEIETEKPSSGGGRCEFSTDWAIDLRPRRARASSRREEQDGPLFQALSHDQLLGLAHDTVEAARDHEPDRVETTTLRLFEAFSDHMLAELPALMRLPAGDPRNVRHGQQQVEDLLLDLAACAAEGTEHCECENLAGEVEAQLARQTSDEGSQLLAAAD